MFVTKVFEVDCIGWLCRSMWLMLRIWCFYGFLFYEMFVIWWQAFQSFTVRATNGYKPELIDWLHSWKVAYQESRIHGDYPIISSDVLLVLRFGFHSRIWQDIEIERFVPLNVCIHLGSGPSKYRLRHFYWNTNVKSSCFGA